MTIAEGAMPHGQQQFRTASVNGSLVTIMAEHLRGFGDAGGLMDFEARERSHARRLVARVLRTRVLRARGLGAAEDFFSATGACAFFSCSAFHTRSGVKGKLR